VLFGTVQFILDVCKRRGFFLDSWCTSSCTRRALLHGVSHIVKINAIYRVLCQLQHVIKIRIKVNLGVRLNWASIDCLPLYIVIFRYWNLNGWIRCLIFHDVGAVTSNRRGEASPFSWSGSPRRSLASPKRRRLFTTCHHVTFWKAWIFVIIGVRTSNFAEE